VRQIMRSACGISRDALDANIASALPCVSAHAFHLPNFTRSKALRWTHAMAELRRPPAWGQFLIAACALTAAGAVARAEPIADRLLLGVRVAERNACTIVKIEFNGRVR
jgi:hypothetical protein